MRKIYQERIRDLFDLSKDNLQIKESKPQGIFVSRVIEGYAQYGDIELTFDDIGALEILKETLRESVMLHLQRQELFTKERLTKCLKGLGELRSFTFFRSQRGLRFRSQFEDSSMEKG
ncbi:hypothetical protein CASFOL_025041 [Castilleja foliolosa]|uniref:Uncharacterized protein n=1 Tax=Castilleja foliolosa TaxID=1961234 RepID=A0ABD3CU14_9LAMI